MAQVVVDRTELSLGWAGSSEFAPDVGSLARLLQAVGCRSWVAGPSARPPSRESLRHALPPVTWPAVRHPWTAMAGDPKGLDWSRLDASDAAAAALDSAVNARVLGATWLILDWSWSAAPATGLLLPDGAASMGVSRDRVLDHVCRVLHHLYTATQMRLAVRPRLSVEGSLPDPETCALLLEDLGLERAGYWHDTAHAELWSQRSGHAASAWLDRLASRCVGVDLVDVVDGEGGLPPGTGSIDFRAIGSALGRETIRVVPVSAGLEGPATAAFAHLRGVGF